MNKCGSSSGTFGRDYLEKNSRNYNSEINTMMMMIIIMMMMMMIMMMMMMMMMMIIC